jgi:adenine-specific DNA-methyltransferase
MAKANRRWPTRFEGASVADHYESLSKNQLVNLLRKKDAEKKLGLVWEKDEIERDAAIDANFVACTIDPALSDGAAPWRNLVIEGDNFDALRWLRMTHAHRVKCIYIDPPYNTGNKDWVYNDHYIDPNDRYRHSTWLEFLFRRLSLARDLLSNDGVILVSINDENRAKLELMMDEALPGMRLGTFVWRTRSGGNEGGASFFSDNHEHVLIYGNSEFSFGGTAKSFAAYGNADNHPDGDWTSSDLTVAVAYDDKRAGKAYYPIYDPETDIWYPCNPDRVWGYVSSKISGESTRIKSKFIEQLIDEKRVKFPDSPVVKVWQTRDELMAAVEQKQVPSSGATLMIHPDLPDFDDWVGRRVGYGMPRLKKFRSDLKTLAQPLSSWITPRQEASGLEESYEIVSGTNDEGAKVIKEVFGSKAFNYAKPVSLIRELVRQSTSFDDIVVDFFAGSATTAQAVMEVNADDQGSRRFIMVSSSEATADEPDKNICRDVTAERVRRLNAATTGKYADLSAEFAYLRTREIDFENLALDLNPDEEWAALEALHGLPLTLYDAKAPWNEHEGDATVLILAERTDPALIDRLKALVAARANVFVYSWTPGQIKAELAGADIEIRPVRETLVRRFQQ